MISLTEKLISTLFYMLLSPEIIRYGNHIYSNIPIIKIVNYILGPILFLKDTLPIGNFWIFIILFFGVVRNPKVPYFLRFNIMQVILLKLTFIITEYIYILIISINNIRFINESIQTFVFIGGLTFIIFAIVQTLRGIQADLPLITDATRMQI